MDEEILRLQDIIADLRRKNVALRCMLMEAIDLADLAIKLDAAQDEGADDHECDDRRLEAPISRASKVG